MLIPVLIHRNHDHGFRGSVPDLPECQSIGPSAQQALTMLKLKIEGHLSQLLGRGQSLPEITPFENIADSGQRYEMHINLDHLRAVAVHQKGQWD
jgi:predicted RNase H-like HicB family nuclease